MNAPAPAHIERRYIPTFAFGKCVDRREICDQSRAKRMPQHKSNGIVVFIPVVREIRNSGRITIFTARTLISKQVRDTITRQPKIQLAHVSVRVWQTAEGIWRQCCLRSPGEMLPAFSCI